MGSCLHYSSAFWVLNDDKNKILYFLKARSLYLIWGLSSLSIRGLGFQERSLALYLRKEFQFLPAWCETTDICSLGFHPALSISCFGISLLGVPGRHCILCWNKEERERRKKGSWRTDWKCHISPCKQIRLCKFSRLQEEIEIIESKCLKGLWRLSCPTFYPL